MNANNAANIAISRLYPDLTSEEAKRAEENLEGYLALVIRIYGRIAQDPDQLAELRAALYERDAAHATETAKVLTEIET